MHRDLQAEFNVLMAAIDERAELYSLLLLAQVPHTKPLEKEINRLFHRLELLEKEIRDADHHP